LSCEGSNCDAVSQGAKDAAVEAAPFALHAIGRPFVQVKACLPENLTAVDLDQVVRLVTSGLGYKRGMGRRNPVDVRRQRLILDLWG